MKITTALLIIGIVVIIIIAGIIIINKMKPKKEKIAFSNEEYENDYELKSQGLEKVLGEMHNMVGHAIIPFAVGGSVDMYYFPNHIKGTGFATMEVLEPDGTGPMPNDFGTYELVAFTKYDYETTENDEIKTKFDLIERRICTIFTAIGSYSREAVLNPFDTCEIPNDDNENICLVFDLYEPDGKEFFIGERKHHLLLCLQVFRDEMDYARENGSKKLIQKLKDAGYYPYSDPDRESVINK